MSVAELATHSTAPAIDIPFLSKSDGMVARPESKLRDISTVECNHIAWFVER
jgi:hypothetical protein